MSLTLAEAAEALRHVAPDARELWLRMGMALKAEYGEEAFGTWDAWSAEASSYRPGDAKTVWKSLKGSGRVTIGTLIHAAKQGGWTPQERTAAELAQLDRERAQRQRDRQAADRAEAARVAAWHERIAELAERCLAEGVLSTTGRAPYLGQKKVGRHGVYSVPRGALLIVDDRDALTHIITGRDAIKTWFDGDARDADGLSIRYLTAGTLAVPMRDSAARLWGWQFIFPKGAKKFLKHTRKSGCFHLVGEIREGVSIALAEGYATAASVHEATGWPVAVCFDAANLAPVAQALRERYPRTRLIVCGDDDHETAENAGRKYATQAAAQVVGVAVFPTFAASAGLSDFNDLQHEQGREAVRAQLLGGGDGGGDSGGGDSGGGDEPPEDWDRRLARDKGGRPHKNLHTLITILEHHPAWRGVFRLDAFADQVQIARAAPYGAPPGALADVDGSEVAAWFADPAHGYRIDPSSKLVLEAIEVVAARQSVHPVLAYLDGLTWDGEPRLDHLLADYFGAAYDEYTAAVGRNWLMSAVARVRRPGAKVDFMPILEGRQGLGKSTAVRTLCGPEWFAEMLESPQNKDFYQVLAGRWIIEIPELQSFSKADRNRIKAAISAQEDTYRPSYGRKARQFLRQNIFVGTTNDDAYLKDETGARRFMPVLCDEVDIGGLAAIRDQLWAEADARYARGETYWEFPAQARDEQDARYDADVWEQPILDWLEGRTGSEYPHEYPSVDAARPLLETTVYDVMTFALKIDVAKQSKQDQMRVAAVLKHLGFRRAGQKTGPGRSRPRIYRRD